MMEAIVQKRLLLLSLPADCLLQLPLQRPLQRPLVAKRNLQFRFP